MKHIKLYEEFLNINSDINTLRYLNEDISYLDWKKNMNKDIYLIKENILTNASNWIKQKGKSLYDKCLSMLHSIIVSVKKHGSKITSKIMNVIKNIYNLIQIFKKKHPYVYKLCLLLIIVTLIIAFVIITSSTAMASQPGLLNDQQAMYNILIGYMEELKSIKIKSGEFDMFQNIQNTQAYLMLLRDGVEINSGDIDQEKLDNFNTIIKASGESLKKYLSEHGNDKNILNKLMEIGHNFIRSNVSGFSVSDLSKVPH